MKKFSRLTALLLAITMLVTSMPLMALADSITVDIDTWNSWVEEAQNAAANQTETVTTTVPVTGETSVVDRPVVEAALTAHAGTETSATQAATLPIAGKLVLKAFDGASSYQWQVKAGSQWANIVGDKGSTVTLTYAKIQNAISGGAAQVRCVMVVDGQDYVSATAQVTVDETVTYTTVETESTLTVTEKVQAVGYSARSGNNAGNATTYNTSSTIYNVKITYVLSTSGKEAAPTKVYQLVEGKAFTQVVESPEVTGYAPDQASVTIAYNGVGQPADYVVKYSPVAVAYQVKHFLQNQAGDAYDLYKTEDKTGLTESKVDVTPLNIAGYTNLVYETPAIAADGSTVVEVYYDRSYFLMNFDLDGGYGVEPIYARYGTPIGNVGTPTKAGYSFVGWNPELPSTMPAGNQTYKAIWEADDTAKVTVVFWGENADDDEYSYIKSAQVNVKPGTEFTYNESGSLVCGQEEHTHSLANNCYTLTCTQEDHTHSENCYTCGQTNHTHDTSCYAGVGSASSAGLGAPDNPSNGYVARAAWSWDAKVIYINGTWYKYTGNTRTGNIAPATCGKTEGTHTHTDACLGCNKTEHTHSIENKCYTMTCTKTEHSHTSACYMSGAGLDSNLWKFVRSDTVSVAADGSSVVNVYYDRTEKTLTFKYNYSNRNYQSTETITAKWGANISEQYKKIAANAKSTFWSAETSGDGPYTNYFGVMPQTSATYYNRGKTGDTGNMTYWGQDLNGNYTVKLFEVTGVGGYYVTDEDRYEFQGFTYHHGTSNNSDCGGAAFYYTRNSYTLTFNDGYNDVEQETVLYEAPLSTYDSYAPAVPSAYEPGSVTFGGWYLNPECTGEEYKLNKHTMPADNVLLYAKWVPVTHKIEFYLDKAALDAGTKLSTHPDITVSHGSKADPTPATPTNGSYTFVGWFYMDGDVEKAFDFANMPVNKDLQVYGKWSSKVLVDYTIYFLDKKSGAAVADPITGSGLATSSKTFEAKYGPELYDEDYFPTVASQTLVLDIEAQNTLTFWYVKTTVPYTVRYLEKDTNTVLHEEKYVADNTKSYVTETFVPISGYMPDEPYKSLKLYVDVDDAGNITTPTFEIIFYYKKDDTHAMYLLNYWLQKADGTFELKMSKNETGYTENSGSNQTLVSAAPDRYSADNYHYDASLTTYTVGTGDPQKYENPVGLTSAGLAINHYYVENTAKISYVPVGGGTVSLPEETLKVVSGTAAGSTPDPDEHYQFVGWFTDADCTNPVMPGWVDATGKLTPTKNVGEVWSDIIYYAKFEEQEATINYIPVGPDGNVLTDNTIGYVTPTSENVTVITGYATGSTATLVASPAYKFVGWYSNAACTSDYLVSTDAKYVPTQPGRQTGDDNVVINGLWPTVTNYYAKFEYNLTSLTITKDFANNEYDSDACFVFKVTGGGLDMNVAIQGNGSVTIDGLTVGTKYTVEEISGNWRYTLDTKSNEITLDPDANKNVVTITNTRKTDQWLDDNAYCENVFTAVADGTGN